jgi:hypothetical protein
MRKTITYRQRCASCLAGLAMACFVPNGALATEDAGAGSVLCARREALLMILVEAHGAFPNAASDKLAAESAALMQARTACDTGQALDAIVFYDRLIAELTTSLAQRNQAER